ncbi:hypothetical protein [Imhoffiella purpurea]|uniref:Uncharacterized protein n=1 Tax=Imhoffiella purpurea TaxID=1249627 RepID=W9VBN3_9GAMM|nr:hypothetical protein [Imhoffiella purpurea]EXJ16824.1 hypothetical protein D779_2435 [Imhoffiella purpurea]
MPNRLLPLACIAWLSSALGAAPQMGLAYQPYVGQWSQFPDNPYASDRFYTPSFNTYKGGLSIEDPERSLLRAQRHVHLYFDAAGRLMNIEADSRLEFAATALRGATDAQWSRTLFRRFEGKVPLPAREVDHQASVFRQLAFLAEAAEGAPLRLATYGAGFQAGYWSEIDGRGYATMPVWTDNRVSFHPGNGSPPTTDRSTDEINFYFPPTSVYVKPDPKGVRVRTRGTPGQDLALDRVDLRLFAPARQDEPDARLNPGFFAGDANGQIALAAAEINARAGKPLLTIAQGVENVAVAGSLINDRMRFAILAALAQARIANDRFPGTVTHLIVGNEYAVPATKSGTLRTPTEQTTEMVRFAKAQMAPGGDFAGLGLAVGVRGNRFRLLDPNATDPAIRRFTRDATRLLGEVDFLMENIYPSPEALEIAARSGDWDTFFAPETGELDIQWERLSQSVATLAGDRPIELMIGEIGHPSNGIPFNLPGHGNPNPPADSAIARLAEHIERDPWRLETEGLAILHRYCSPDMSAAFLTRAFAWSRARGVQIHAFEAFDEPYKFGQNMPLPGLDARASLLNCQGSHGAEGFYGLFGYSGVAAFQAGPSSAGPKPGSALQARLPRGVEWADQFSGQLYPKLPAFDFAATAAAFEPVTRER